MFVEMNGGEILVKITVSGPPGSGTSTLVERLVDAYSWVSLNGGDVFRNEAKNSCLLYTSPSPRDLSTSRMPSSA